jgi:hypothetical protein
LSLEVEETTVGGSMKTISFPSSYSGRGDGVSSCFTYATTSYSYKVIKMAKSNKQNHPSPKVSLSFISFI